MSLLAAFKSLLPRQKFALAMLFVLLFGASALVTFFSIQYRSIVVTPNRSVDQVLSIQPSPDPWRPISILLMGYGGGSHQGGKLTDTMMLAYIQPRLKTVHLISLPRDLWVKLPIVDGQAAQGWKINAAYALGSDDRNYRHKPVQYTGEAGGGELAKLAVEQATGIKPDYFITLNFASFRRSIDVLGGIDVMVERSFDDYQYPIEGEEENTCGRSDEDMKAIEATLSAEKAEPLFTCRYEHLHFDKGVVHMDGETALKFVRSRHSAQDGNDFGRAARQRNVISALKNKVLAVNFIPKAIPFIATLASDLQTDISVSKMQEFLNVQNEIQNYTILSVALTDQNVFRFGRSNTGQFILLPKLGEDQWQDTHAFVQQSLSIATQSAIPTIASHSSQAQ